MSFRGKVYVPKSTDLQRKIVELHHDSYITRHPGNFKTMELVSCNYWWPGMIKFIKEYIKGCDTCNWTKTFLAQPAVKLMLNPIPSEPWVDISIDMIVKLPESQGFDSILVVCDRYTKQSHFVPCNEELSALGLATLYRDNIWKHHGLPTTVISDRGPQFASNLMRELNKMLGIKTSLSTAYHPQPDGQTERTNQEIEQYLRLFINNRQDNWADWISIAEFSFNNKFHTATQMTPFYANSGRHPRMGFKPLHTSKVEAASDFVD